MANRRNITATPLGYQGVSQTNFGDINQYYDDFKRKEKKLLTNLRRINETDIFNGRCDSFFRNVNNPSYLKELARGGGAASGTTIVYEGIVRDEFGNINPILPNRLAADLVAKGKNEFIVKKLEFDSCPNYYNVRNKTARTSYEDIRNNQNQFDERAAYSKYQNCNLQMDPLFHRVEKGYGRDSRVKNKRKFLFMIPDTYCELIFGLLFSNIVNKEYSPNFLNTYFFILDYNIVEQPGSVTVNVTTYVIMEKLIPLANNKNVVFTKRKTSPDQINGIGLKDSTSLKIGNFVRDRISCYYMLFSVVHGLYVGQRTGHFTHYDLHIGNMAVREIDSSKPQHYPLYRQGVAKQFDYVTVKGFNFVPVIIDYGTISYGIANKDIQAQIQPIQNYYRRGTHYRIPYSTFRRPWGNESVFDEFFDILMFMNYYLNWSVDKGFITSYERAKIFGRLFQYTVYDYTRGFRPNQNDKNTYIGIIDEMRAYLFNISNVKGLSQKDILSYKPNVQKIVENSHQFLDMKSMLQELANLCVNVDGSKFVKGRKVSRGGGRGGRGCRGGRGGRGGRGYIYDRIPRDNRFYVPKSVEKRFVQFELMYGLEKDVIIEKHEDWLVLVHVRYTKDTFPFSLSSLPDGTSVFTDEQDISFTVTYIDESKALARGYEFKNECCKIDKLTYFENNNSRGVSINTAYFHGQGLPVAYDTDSRYPNKFIWNYAPYGEFRNEEMTIHDYEINPDIERINPSVMYPVVYISGGSATKGTLKMTDWNTLPQSKKDSRSYFRCGPKLLEDTGSGVQETLTDDIIRQLEEYNDREREKYERAKNDKKQYVFPKLGTIDHISSKAMRSALFWYDPDTLDVATLKDCDFMTNLLANVKTRYRRQIDDIVKDFKPSIGFFTCSGRNTTYETINDKFAGGPGLTLRELSKLLKLLGAGRAINLDGGGSAGISWRLTDNVINSSNPRQIINYPVGSVLGLVKENN